MQPFWHLTPGLMPFVTLNVKGFLQLSQSRVSPLPKRLITFRCCLNELAAALLMLEKSIVVILLTLSCGYTEFNKARTKGKNLSLILE